MFIFSKPSTYSAVLLALAAFIIWPFIAQQPDQTDVDFSDKILELNQKISSGEVQLEFENQAGYLRSLLNALDVPVESQIVVFSKTSLQKNLISATNPRAIFFNDSLSVAWMDGGFIEVAALNSEQGIAFYLLSQSATSVPQLTPEEQNCHLCHITPATFLLPSFLISSVPATSDGSILPWLGNYLTDHRSPLEERWGGWYITGTSGLPHMGNMIIADRNTQEISTLENTVVLSSLDAQFDVNDYLSPHSDIVAHLVFDHQMGMMNLLGQIAAAAKTEGQTEQESSQGLLLETAIKVVDYMLFIEEAPLAGVTGTSGFTEIFSARGPFDSQGRSLRQFDLDQQLMRYTCSYMIYSEAFTKLPLTARQAIYARLWEVLSGQDNSEKYAALSAPERLEIIEILKDTKEDIPAVFL